MRMDQMFPSRTLAAKDVYDFNPAGITVTIAGVATEVGTDPRTKQPYSSFKIQFVELKKPMNLNKTNAAVLFAQWSDSDDWIGKIVHIQGVQSVMTDIVNNVPVQKQIYVWSVSIANQQARPLLPPNTDITAIAAEVEGGTRKPPPGCVLRALGSGSGDEPLSLPASRDIRPIGPDIAKKLVAQLKLKSTNFDQMLKWLRANDADAATAMSGVELHEIPAWTLASAKYYMDSLNMPPELVQPPKQEETIEIDVPF